MPAVVSKHALHIGFRNRIALSAAFAWAVTPQATLRAGYPYNGQIQPDETLSPVFTLIARRDYAMGLSHELQPDWSLHAGLEYQPYSSRRYSNPDLPLFGDSGKAVNEGLFLHLMVSRRW